MQTSYRLLVMLSCVTWLMSLLLFSALPSHNEKGALPIQVMFDRELNLHILSPQLCEYHQRTRDVTIMAVSRSSPNTSQKRKHGNLLHGKRRNRAHK